MREQYSPFAPGEQPRPFPLVKLTAVPNAADGPAPPRCDEFVHRAKKVTNLKVDWAGDFTAEVTLSCNGSKLFSGPLKGGHPAVGLDAYAADLNSDGFSDYILFTYSGGCGLAAEITWVMFLLSSSTGYRSTSVLSYAAEPSDLIAINDRACLVHTSFVYAPVGKDSRQHNYWVYNILSFSDTELVLANDLDRRFPKWVWYSFAENHRDTDQLTSAQRQLSLKQILASD